MVRNFKSSEFEILNLNINEKLDYAQLKDKMFYNN